MRFVAETGSTNADLLALAASGAEEGLWLRAGRQTQGRGRLARHWESPDGNLYASTIIRLRADDPPAASLALVAAVALWQCIDHWLPGKPSIKWPNDIMVGGAKLSGILLERTGDAVVIGFGVNVTGHPDLLDRPTTSLWAQGAVEADAGLLQEQLADRVAHGVGRWRAGGVSALRPFWLGAAHPPGTPLRVALPGGATIEGRFADLDPDGALILDLPGGGTHAVHAGDIFLI